MVTTHNLGYPRIGAARELKFALESYWKGQSSREALGAVAAELRRRNWADQGYLDFAAAGDFSLYDHVLDMSLMLGNLPRRVQQRAGDSLDNYFLAARGDAGGDADAHEACCAGIAAGEMTKWFDTNYHYIVPEFDAHTSLRLDASRLLAEIDEARRAGVTVKPVLIGPVTYLALGKTRDGSSRLALLERLLVAYAELLETLAGHGVPWVQIDEPVLATELDLDWQQALNIAYHRLRARRPRILLATYFGALHDNRYLAANLPVDGLHIDAVQGREDVLPLLNLLGHDKVLSLGVIDGRNVWKTDLGAVLDWLEPLAQRLGERLWIAPSCSLLHVPLDLEAERALDPQLRSWLAFARQKLDELRLLAQALRHGRDSVADELRANRAAVDARRSSPRVHRAGAVHAPPAPGSAAGRRRSAYAQRAPRQAAWLRLPLYPTTTIGSFPQTPEIRRARSEHKAGRLDDDAYRQAMRQEIERCVREQEGLGLDVLVHGEAERNDMVEYFAEQLDGYAISRFGWVQSYGSRCVKPPILFGDVSRPRAMTVEWTRYAQSLSSLPMKGMLTGPVTLLNWSFVRDDQPRSVSCHQLALAVREEVLDLERAGVRIIQIDEAALREGLPLRRSQWAEYLDWAVEAFRISANGVADETQIHTHMCYSEFQDILPAIAAMDADVITIETSRSGADLLEAFEDFRYPNEIGPGVYDIHSPAIPSRGQIESLLRRAAARIPAQRLWVNPDCGLKTRQWPEVLSALANMVAAARQLRSAA